jgi:hypothetical protein
MIFSRHTDEPSIHPSTPPATLWRLARLRGALERETAWDAMPIYQESLARAQKQLELAAQISPNVGEALALAQAAIYAVYEAATRDEDEAELVVRLGFPDTRIQEKDRVGPVDVSTVVATHFKPARQIFTTISFEEAHGATAYWLLEIRILSDGIEAIDAIVENYAPCFSRVRLPVGPHRFVIESRNPSRHARTEEFTLEVPAL